MKKRTITLEQKVTSVAEELAKIQAAHVIYIAMHALMYSCNYASITEE